MKNISNIPNDIKLGILLFGILFFTTLSILGFTGFSLLDALLINGIGWAVILTITVSIFLQYSSRIINGIGWAIFLIIAASILFRHSSESSLNKKEN